MGFGKSVSVLTAIRDLLDSGTIRAAIIVAPVRVALSTWPNEIRKWEHTKDIDFVNLSGTPEQRMKKLREPHQLYICSTDSLVWLFLNLWGDHGLRFTFTHFVPAFFFQLLTCFGACHHFFSLLFQQECLASHLCMSISSHRISNTLAENPSSN
jgi:hypothetical protein